MVKICICANSSTKTAHSTLIVVRADQQKQRFTPKYRPEVHAALAPGEPDSGWQENTEKAARREQPTQPRLLAQRVLRPVLGLRKRGLGASFLRELAGESEVAAPGALRDAQVAEIFLPIIHLVFSNLKTWLRGIHHGVSPQHLQAYLNEFTFRFNRSFYPFNAFRSLLGIAGDVTAPTYAELYAKKS